MHTKAAARNEAQALATAQSQSKPTPHNSLSGASEILGRAAQNLDNMRTKAATAERAKQLGLSGYGTDSDDNDAEHTHKRARRSQQGPAMRAVKADIFHQNRVARMKYVRHSREIIYWL